MTVKSTKKPVDINDLSVEELRARLAELEGEKDEIKPDYAEEPIRQDEYISVMSLLPYPLNLSTKEFGQGSIKKFTKFGEKKKILYRELLDIMEVHPNFAEAGYFYILDQRFIRQNGLDEMYSKILTKEKIEQILEANSDDCVELYNSANKEQQSTIVQLLVDKVRENQDSVNLNVIDKLSRASGINISERAKETLLPVQEE